MKVKWSEIEPIINEISNLEYSINMNGSTIKEYEDYEMDFIEQVGSINQLLDKLYYLSLKLKYYWFDCPFEVYINTIDDRFNEYKLKYVDVTYFDFLDLEYQKHTVQLDDSRELKSEFTKVNYSKRINSKMHEKFNYSLQKKIEYLKSYSTELGHTLKGNDLSQEQKKITFEEFGFNNLEDNIHIEIKTAGRKVMFLKELGVLDFLIEKHHLRADNTLNCGGLATIIVGMTGEKQRTLSDILLSIYNNSGKNNPYPANEEYVFSKIEEIKRKYPTLP